MNRENWFASLPNHVLHAVLHSESLEALDFLYRSRVTPQQEYIESSVFDDKILLGRIFAFASADKLSSREFRANLFNHMPTEWLEETGTAVLGGAVAINQIPQSLARVPWRSNDSRAVRLAEKLGLPPSVLPEPSPASPSEHLTAPTESFKFLHSYQADVVERALEFLRPPNSRCLVQMPTGAGKTRVAMDILARLFRKRGGGLRVLWLAHVQELCAQAENSFRHVGNSLGHET